MKIGDFHSHTVAGGLLTSVACEHYDFSVFLYSEDRSRIIDRVGKKILLNVSVYHDRHMSADAVRDGLPLFGVAHIVTDRHHNVDFVAYLERGKLRKRAAACREDEASFLHREFFLAGLRYRRNGSADERALFYPVSVRAVNDDLVCIRKSVV